MTHTRTQNPARAVAISGALIIVLIAAAVGVSVWRFSAAQHSYDRVGDQAAGTLVVLGDLRQNMLDRSRAVITFYAEGKPAQLAKLPTLERQFNALILEAQLHGDRARRGPGELRRAAPAQSAGRRPGQGADRRRGRAPRSRARQRRDGRARQPAHAVRGGRGAAGPGAGVRRTP